MKHLAAPALVLSLLLGFAGFILLRSTSFYYPHFVDNEPLRHPIKVVAVHEANLTLEDGRIITLDYAPADLAATLAKSDDKIDVDNEETLAVYAREKIFICGTQWRKPIRIPLFPLDVNENARRIISCASWSRSTALPTIAP